MSAIVLKQHVPYHFFVLENVRGLGGPYVK